MRYIMMASELAGFAALSTAGWLVAPALGLAVAGICLLIIGQVQR